MRFADYVKNYKQICYCEIIIKPNGSIELAQPSHIMKLIELSRESYDSIYEKMPTNAGPLSWLVGYTNCVAVWYDGYMYSDKITEKQKRVIKQLKQANCIAKDGFATLARDLEICGVV